MHRFINQINVSITTNRTCTLRCDHCYIAPHLFSDKTQMTTETFRAIFPQVERLFLADHNLHEVEWEAIGGETTMMPFEWWEENLPWALDWIHAFNQRHNISGSLNFLSNLIYKDQRYTDLINQYGHHPAFCLYTSWEPDTNRFGKRNQLYERFRNTLASIDARDKILDLIFTRDLVELGAEWVLNEFVPLGITDFSIKMLSPYGSGKAFFEQHMVDFDRMTDFLLDLDRLKPDHVTFTPQEEMLSSIYRGTSFQCNGNFKYDVAIEPDGRTTFNASQTADEAALGAYEVHISDPLWAEKVMFENKPEESAKLTLSHPQCHQCEYMHHCNAGWYHYKVHDPAVVAQYADGECPGYKRLWDHVRDGFPQEARADRGQANHLARMREINRAARVRPPALPLQPLSAWGDDWQRMVEQANRAPYCRIEADRTTLFGKSLLLWLWFLDDRRWPVTIPAATLTASMEAPEIIRHYVYANFHSVSIDADTVWAWVRQRPAEEISRIILTASLALEASAGGIGPTPPSPIHLVHDDRNDELYRWLLANPAPADLARGAHTLTGQEVDYFALLRERVDKEACLLAALTWTAKTLPPPPAARAWSGAATRS